MIRKGQPTERGTTLANQAGYKGLVSRIQKVSHNSVINTLQFKNMKMVKTETPT